MSIHKPLHPGLIVKDALIDHTGLTVTEAASRLGVTRMTLSRLLNGRSGISPEMALRLSKFFQTSVESWMNLQTQYDIWLMRNKTKRIKVKPYKHSAYA
jgi:addiction module HigA family antidote